MERSKLLMWLIVAVAAVIIVWRVGFVTPESKQPEVSTASKIPAEPNGPEVAQQPGDANEPKLAADANEPKVAVADANEPKAAPDVNEPKVAVADANELGDPNDPLVAVNLNDVEMKDVIQKLAEWTGKVIIPTDEAKKQKITIYAKDKLPRSQALQHIYSALRTKKFIAEHTNGVIYLKPLEEAKYGTVPTIDPNYPLAMVENKQQVVQKFFRLVNYSPSQMGDVIRPLIGEYGYVGADETTGNLLVIDTVANLLRMERIIVTFDVPEAEQTVREIFVIEHGDPSEIVQLLRMLLGDESTSRSIRGPSRGGYRGSSGPRPSGGGSSRGGESRSAAASSVVIGPSQLPVILIPEPRRKWIIATASAEDMKLIGEWIKKLDKPEPVESEYETIPITYADVREVATRLTESLEQFPGSDIKASVLVQPLEQARQIMVFGRKDLRDMVRKLILEVDIPPGEYETKVFDLEYADPEQIKENIDSLYGETGGGAPMYDSYYYYRYGPGSRQRSPSEIVKVIAFPTMGQVTVIAAPENMRRIELQIKEWDVPLDVEKVKPRIIELRNIDPVQTADLLSTLFTEETTGRFSIYDYIFGRGGTQDRKKIIGPLYGQLTFEDLPGTKKIIVISKIPEAYDVVEAFVQDLDRQEMAEVPKVIQLKYADPEELAERLNALFNEPGTTATIRWSERGLSEARQDESDNQSSGGGGGGGGGGGDGGTSQGEYTPWWSRGARMSPDQEPISNVIGRVRFIPDTHSKSILVLSPPEFMDNIEAMIGELDIPGKQVMVKAVVVQIDHTDMTSLGLQLTSDESKWLTLDSENATTAFGQLRLLQERGSVTLEAGASVTALLDFLVKKLDAKILNQQTLWTKDNEEAEFFKGQIVGFQTKVAITGTGIAQPEYAYEQVGMTLKARPSITPEKNVDMIVRVMLSQLTSEEINNQRVRTEMDTTTNMIVQDGQTIMLGGILFQEESTINRKIPLLGDLPLAGGLFQHNEAVQANSEMLVFITPYVVDEAKNMLPEAMQEMEQQKKKLDDIREELEEVKTELESAHSSNRKQQGLKTPETEQAADESEKIETPLKERTKQIAEVYYHSMKLYHSGQLAKAREGLAEVVASGLIPAAMKETIEGHLVQIDTMLPRTSVLADASHVPEP